jgi:hypothetical protein
MLFHFLTTGKLMKLKLSTDDRNAIDLLLDQTATAAHAPSQNYVAAAGTQHVHAVENILKLLQVLPVSEPPADLVSRTLAHISQTTGQVMAGQMSAPRHLTDRQSLRPA